MEAELVSVVLFVLCCSLFLVSCSESGSKISGLPEITPSTCDWKITLYASEHYTNPNNLYWIAADWLGDPNLINSSDSASVTINNTTIPLIRSSYHPQFSAENQEFAPGQTITIDFRFNGVLKVSTEIMIPHKINVIFPYYFNESYEVTWTLDTSNQYQYATAIAVNFDNQYEQNAKKTDLKPSSRKHKFKISDVNLYDNGTLLIWIIGEASHKLVDRVAIRVLFEKYNGYTSTQSKSGWQRYPNAEKFNFPGQGISKTPKGI